MLFGLVCQNIFGTGLCLSQQGYSMSLGYCYLNILINFFFWQFFFMYCKGIVKATSKQYIHKNMIKPAFFGLNSI